jgi:hypothetical protein
VIPSVLRRGGAAARTAARRVRRLTDLWRERLWERDQYGQAITAGELTALLRRMTGGSFSEYCERQRVAAGSRSFVPANRVEVARRLNTEWPSEAAATIAAADRLLRGTFDLLGSGPVDMRRPRGGGTAIDWNRDPITHRRYTRRVSHWRALVPATFASVRADIKGPWEIGRCQHLPTLGQAYWLTGDERFARAFAGTVADFIRRNPVGFGVQWTCAMDVALRIVSWLVALSFFQGAPALDSGWWALFLRSVVEHGRFIAANLEFGTLDGRLVTSNHYLADLFGLGWIAYTFPELDANCVWRGLAEFGLEREIEVQIHPDGGSFESSLPYQRLVAEMCLSAYAMALHVGRPFSRQYRDRLLASLAMIRTLRQPDGRIPQIGDCDNGRAHILTRYGTWRQESTDHLLAAGARVLHCAALVDGIAHADRIEEVFWDVADPVPAEWTGARCAERFPDSGLAVLRNDRAIVVLCNGRVGTMGFGNHKHCDQLAVEVCIGGRPVFVDAGTYVYTSSPEERNRFRGTEIHNTVTIDGTEQHQLRPDWLFRLFQEGDAWLCEPEMCDGGARVRGGHTAYTRLVPPVVHERDVTLSSTGTIVITDRFDAPAMHRFRWHFLLHPDVRAERRDPAIRLTWASGSAVFTAEPRLAFEIADSWYSPSYGVRIPTTALVGETDAALPAVTLALCPDVAAVDDAS